MHGADLIYSLIQIIENDGGASSSIQVIDSGEGKLYVWSLQAGEVVVFALLIGMMAEAP